MRPEECRINNIFCIGWHKTACPQATKNDSWTRPFFAADRSKTLRTPFTSGFQYAQAFRKERCPYRVTFLSDRVWYRLHAEDSWTY
jgi:hypothetical protein